MRLSPEEGVDIPYNLQHEVEEQLLGFKGHEHPACVLDCFLWDFLEVLFGPRLVGLSVSQQSA